MLILLADLLPKPLSSLLHKGPMDYYYRNVGKTNIRFELNNDVYEIEPDKCIIIPKKYDYAIDLMKIKNLEKDAEISVWAESQQYTEQPIPIPEPKVKRTRKKKE